jgi:hypothetical protein
MIKTNYAFEKRQKEIAKKQKKQEKLLHKTAHQNERAEPEQDVPSDEQKPVQE